MKIEVKGQRLVVLLEGMERVWALKASICLQVEDVVGVQWFAERPSPPLALRAPGTGAPRLFYAGSFWRKNAWEFWYLRVRVPGFLVITSKNKRYKVLRLTTDEATAFLVRDWLNRHQQTKHIA